MTRSARIAAVLLLVGWLTAINAAATTSVTFDVTARLGYQTSDQHLNKNKITDWTAPLVGIDGTLGFSPSEILRLEGRGGVDVLFDSGRLYTGIAGESTDYTATQLALNGEGDAGLVLGNADRSLMPFAGVGVRTWSWSVPSPAFVYIKSWSAVYGVIGVRGDAHIGSKPLYARIDIQIPFEETVSVDGRETTLESGSTRMVKAELEVVAGRLLLGLWGEWFKYSSDSLLDINPSGADHSITISTIGIKLGAAF